MTLSPEPILLRLKSGYGATEGPAGLRVSGPGGELVLREPPGAVRAALLALAEGPAREDVLEEGFVGSGDFAGLSRYYFHLDRLKRRNLVAYLVRGDGRDLLEAAPMVRGAEFRPSPVDAAAEYRVSRFACSRAADGRTLLATALSDVEILLCDPRVAALVAALARPRTAAALARIAGIPEGAVLACLALLAAARTVGVVRGGAIAEDEDDALRQWEPHDLVFHTRSRLGRHAHPIGGTFRFAATLPPQPAVRAAYPAEPIVLARRDPISSGSAEDSLAAVMAARRSIRRHGRDPISRDQLGEFLYRTAHIDRLIPADPGRARRYETSVRPYPSGGATFDLELYLTIDRCSGLEPGLYHYDPLLHALRLVAPKSAMTDVLIDGARAASKMEERPQVVVTLTSRFQRLSWKYESIAYATTLKNVGVLYEAMYLVATAMRLAPCALGSGNSDLFSRLIGSDYYRETSVGEFMLGSR